jgi:hypothetical protein
VSATRTKVAAATAVVILNASTVAVSSAATQFSGIHPVPTVALAAVDTFPFNGSYDSVMLLLQSISGNINNSFPSHEQRLVESTQIMINNLLAQGWRQFGDSVYNPATGELIPRPYQDWGIYQLDIAHGVLYDPTGHAVLTFDPADFGITPVDDSPGFGGDLFGSFINTIYDLFRWVGALVDEVMGIFSGLLGGFGVFSAGAIDPLELLTAGAASVDSHFVVDLPNDVLGVGPDGASPDLGTALPDIVAAF